MKRQVLYLIVLLAVAAVAFTVGKQAKSPVKVEDKQVVVDQNEVRTQVYKDSYISGFEGENYKISYSFVYDPNKFSFRPDASLSKLIITEMTKEHRVSFFNNTAAGFASTEEFWKEMNFCSTCVKVSNTINLKDAKDLLSYSNESEEWIIFARDQFFVSIKLIKPTEEARKVVESLDIAIDRQ